MEDVVRMSGLFDCLLPERTPISILADGLSVIDMAFEAGAGGMIPLFSGGHDSLSACFVASKHRRFSGEVFHINTTIGAKATRRFVDEVCAEFGWSLRVFQSNFSYEDFVKRLGFPSPGAHQWVYNRLKDRCVSTIGKGKGRIALITGCRIHESTRRMGSVKPLQIGEMSAKTGIVRRLNRAWTAPCWDWTSEEQREFMQWFDLPENPIKRSPLAMSGECFCGAFARPNEIALIRQHAPDVAEEIDRLSAFDQRGTWGTRRKTEKGIQLVHTGMMCSSCDYKAAAAGLLFEASA
jgi:3'-phosphoadenosine 5'-phosphosulfate sulfotransferase (PAPS reductase)/FAD synthetase